MVGVQAVGLHQPRQPGAMGLVTLGAAVGMLSVLPPPLDRVMHPVYGAELLPLTLVQVSLLVAAQAQTGKPALVLAYTGRVPKGRPVDVVVVVRLDRCRFVVRGIVVYESPP